MGTFTLYPNGILSSTGWITYGAPSPNTLNQALRDTPNLTTGVRFPAAQGTWGLTLALSMDTAVIPANAQIRSITPHVFPMGGTTGRTYNFGVGIPADIVEPLSSFPGGRTSQVLWLGTPLLNKNGVPWTQADIDTIELLLYSYGDDVIVDIGEGAIVVLYNEAPVVSAVLPTGNVTTTAQPTITWTYTDPENDAQERFKVKVYAGTGTVANPDITAALVDSLEQFSSLKSWVVTQALPVGSYRVYVKAADANSNGRYSAWATQTFTIVVDPPATPDVTAVADNANARIALTVQGHDNLLTLNQSSLEVDAVGWEVDANVTGSPSRITTAGAPVHGTGALAWTASAANTAVRTLAANGLRFGVTASKQVTARVSIRTAVALAARNAIIGMRFYDAANALIAGTYEGSSVSITTTHAVISYTGTAPANAVTAVIFVRVTTSAATEVYWIDSIGVFPGTTSTVWWSGDRNTTTVADVFIEKSVDGGVTWTTVRGGNGIEWDTPSNQFITLYDYEVARGVLAHYRARIVATVGALVTSSANSATAGPVSHASTGWWLKDPTNAANNLQIDVAPDFTIRRKEPQQTFEPLGRNVSVVITDGVRGIEGELSLWSKNKTTYDKLQALVSSGRTLWLEDVLGRSWYIHFGPATEWAIMRAMPVAPETTPIRHMHNVRLPFTEVGKPA